MIYLTYNDQPSGVYSSQVNDVCNFLNQELNVKIKLIAIISVRNFIENRNKIRSEVKDALVLPALPTAQHWRFSCILFAIICAFKNEKVIISRNVIATNIALFAKKLNFVKTVCLDGRGAIAAEWNEYEVVKNNKTKKEISSWERKAVIEADYRIAVSTKLVDWWKSNYQYNDQNFIVIPCTLQSKFNVLNLSSVEISKLRSNAGFKDEDLIMAYSGSTSGWQSFSDLEKLFSNILALSNTYKLVFLSKNDTVIDKLKVKFPNQVYNTWLNHNDVQAYLSMCDYGILYREQSITNQVAAPTKFAEYLSAGLPVLISEDIGDYTDFVKNNDCGIVIDIDKSPELTKTTADTRRRMIELADNFYTKKANINKYRKLISSINN